MRIDSPHTEMLFPAKISKLMKIDLILHFFGVYPELQRATYYQVCSAESQFRHCEAVYKHRMPSVVCGVWDIDLSIVNSSNSTNDRVSRSKGHCDISLHKCGLWNLTKCSFRRSMPNGQTSTELRSSFQVSFDQRLRHNYRDVFAMTEVEAFIQEHALLFANN